MIGYCPYCGETETYYDIKNDVTRCYNCDEILSHGFDEE